MHIQQLNLMRNTDVQTTVMPCHKGYDCMMSYDALLLGMKNVSYIWNVLYCCSIVLCIYIFILFLLDDDDYLIMYMILLF
jgi:hypothetical protein